MDREKVIKGLECCRNRINPDLSENEYSCKLCPYAANDYACSPWELYDDTLALLKEQEAVEPIPPEDEFGLYRCGKCYHQLFRCVDKYCSRCGQAVKWE